MLDGTPLGHFAVKKIAVGESHSYLIKILKEVRLLERLHHPNIISYHHSWLETSQFSSFGPRIPTLQYVPSFIVRNIGSLIDFLEVCSCNGQKAAPSTTSSLPAKANPPPPSPSTLAQKVVISSPPKPPPRLPEPLRRTPGSIPHPSQARTSLHPSPPPNSKIKIR